MEGLVPATTTATASTLQLILEHLCAVLLLISEGVRHVPALPAFCWVILAGTLVMVCLVVKRRHMSRRVKAPGKRCPAGNQVCAGHGESTGPMTEADDRWRPVLSGHRPCARRPLNKRLSGTLSPRDRGDLAKAAHESQPPQRAPVTGEEPVPEAPGTDGEQLQENIPDELNENPRQPGSPELLRGGIVGWEQDAQEQQGEKEGLEPSTAPLEWVLQGGVRPSPSLAGTPLQTSPRPAALRGHLAHVKPQVERRREGDDGDPFVQGSEGDPQGVPRDADLNASLPHDDEENQRTARQLREQKQMTEELAAEIANLRTKKASLRRENSNLRAEIQQLTPRLQAQPETCEDQLSQLYQRVFEAERRCLEMEKKFLSNWRNVNSTYQMLNSYKEMTQVMNQELQRSTSYYEKEIRYHRERAEEARTAAARMERRLQELRGEHDRSEQTLAKAKSTFQPSPGGPSAPAAPPAAHRGPEVPGRPLSHQVPRKEQGHAVRAQESRRTCRFDLAPTAAEPPHAEQDAYLCV